LELDHAFFQRLAHVNRHGFVIQSARWLLSRFVVAAAHIVIVRGVIATAVVIVRHSPGRSCIGGRQFLKFYP
jgi:hypothetical protein